MSTTSSYHHEALFPHPVEEVAGYYQHPGTVQRLTPDWAGVVVREPHGLARGQRTELLCGPPWLPSLGSAEPRIRWVAEHTEHTPGEGFVDEMLTGPLRSWRHRHSFLATEDGRSSSPGIGASSRVRDAVEAELPLLGALSGDLPRNLPGWAGPRRFVEARFQAQLRRMFDFRTRQTAADLEFHRFLRSLDAGERPKTVVISGASGLVGTSLSALLRSGGHEVIALTRTPSDQQIPGVRTVEWDPASGRLDAEELIGAHSVINLAGASIMGRFTQKHRERILKSRLDSTSTLVRALADVADRGGPSVLVSASASGFYGQDAGEVTESSPSGEGFLASVCRAWEQAAQEASHHGIRVVTVRTGLVLSARGGLLNAQLPLYLAGGGGPLGGGRMWLPWISLEDLIRVFSFAALNPQISGAVNAAAPHPVRQSEFVRTLGRLLHRPAIIPTPAAAPAALLGRQGAQELALASVRMVPDFLQEAGFPFRHEHLHQALRHTLGRE